MTLATSATFTTSGKFTVTADLGSSVYVYLYSTDNLKNPIGKYLVTDQPGDETLFSKVITVDSGSQYVARWLYIDAFGDVTIRTDYSPVFDVSPPKVSILADLDNNGIVTYNELICNENTNTDDVGELHYTDGATAATDLGVRVKVEVPAYAKAGDTITVQNGDTLTVTLSQTDIDKGAFVVMMPAPQNNGDPIDFVTKWASADGQNTSLNGEVKATLQAYLGDKTKIDFDSITIDNTVNIAESGFDRDSGKFDGAAQVTVSGRVTGGEVLAGNGITLQAGENTYQSTVDADGKFSFQVAGSDLAGVLKDFSGDGNRDVKVTVHLQDVYGNTKDVSKAHDYHVDLDIADPKVEILTDANNDGFVNLQEFNQADGKTTVKVSFDSSKTSYGDYVKVTAGSEVVEVPILDVDQGYVLVELPAGKHGEFMTVTAEISDAADNKSKTGEDSAKFDLSNLQQADGLIKVEITEDANNDGFISATELQGNIDVLITLPKDTQAGDKVFISATGTPEYSIELTQAQVDQGQLNLDFAAPSQGVNFEVSAQVKDAAGNVSNIAKDSAVISTQPPQAPSIQIVEDANGDGFINAKELQGDIDAVVSLPANADAGDVLTVFDNFGHSHTVILSPADVQTKKIPVSFPAPANGETIVITATVTDAAQNVSPEGKAQAVIDTTVYTGLGVEIATDANNDGYINQAELNGGKVEVNVTLPQGAAVGDTVTINASGNTAQVVTLTQADIDSGSLKALFNPTANGTDFVATAEIKDLAGNHAGPVQDDARIQIGMPGEPIVTLTEDANNDGWINAAELQGEIDASVALPASAKAGDTVIITDQSGKVQSITLTLDMVQKGSIDFTATNPGDGKEVKVEAYVKDAAGNLSEVSTDSAMLDLKVPGDSDDDGKADQAPTVTLVGDADDNGYINAQEFKAGGEQVEVRVSLQDANGKALANVEAGDTVVLTDQSGAVQQLTLSAADLANGYVTATIATPNNGQEAIATAYVTDAAGNRSLDGEDRATLDLTAPDTPQVVITEDVNGDGYINAAELQGNVDVTIKLPGSAQAGDTLTVTDNYGNSHDIVLTDGDITAGKVDTTVPAPQDGKLEVTAALTDPAGNTGAAGKADALVDTTVYTGLNVEIATDANNDGYINQAELNGGKVEVNVTLPQGAAVGDTVTINASGNTAQVVTLTQADIDSGSLKALFNPTANGTDFVATAEIKDLAGNHAGPVQDDARIQIGMPGEPIVTLTEDANNDGWINAAELQGEIDASVALPASAKAGDTVIITDQSGKVQSITLTLDMVQKGSIDFTATNPGDGKEVKVEAYVKDAAGNLSEVSTDSAMLDLKVPGDSDDDGKADQAPTVTLVGDADDNGYINAQEFKAGGEQVEVRVSLQDANGKALANVEAGDTVVLTDQSGAVQQLTLSAADLANGYVTATIATPNNGQEAIATAYVTDAAGNRSLDGEDRATLDLTAPDTPQVVITEDVNNDGWINAAELQGEIDVLVTLPQTAEVGDTVVVTDQSGKVQTVVLTAEAVQQGNVALTVTNPGDGQEVKVEGYLKDPAGNASAVHSDSAVIDITAPGYGADAPLVVITEDANDDGWINAKELQGDIGVKITVPSGSMVGDTLVISVNGAQQQVTVSDDMLQNGYVFDTPNPGEGKELLVEAYVKDAAGNASLTGQDSAVVDTTAPGGLNGPQVVITSDADNNGYISSAELGNSNNPINVKITLPMLDVEVGDKLVIDANGALREVVLTVDNIADGYVMTVANPGEGKTVEVSAYIQDAAGNQSVTGLDTAIIDTQVKAGVLTLTNFTDSANPYLHGTDRDSYTNDQNYGLQVNGAEAGSRITYQVKTNGAWVNTGAAQLNMADSDYTYRAKVTDKAGNVAYTNEISVTVDATAPNAPEAVVVRNGEISGWAEAGSVVIIRDAGGNDLGWAQANAQGQFSLNGVYAQGTVHAVAMDKAGNESAPAEAGRHYQVYTAASDWDADTGPSTYESFVTTGGNDWLEIGNGRKSPWTIGTQGNIWNKNPAGGWMNIDTGAGDDRIDTGVSSGSRLDNGGLGNMTAYTRVIMGSGNDTLNLKGSMVSDCQVDMGSDNDIAHIGGFMGTNTLVNMGSGNDTLVVGTDLLSNARAYLGSGDDNMTVRGHVTSGSLIDAGDGNDSVYINGNMLSDCRIEMGSGDDTVSIGGFMGTNTILNMGSGNDTVYVKTMLSGARINLDNGNDTVVFSGKTIDGKINGGGGEDTLILNYTQDGSLVQGSGAWKHVTNISTANISGFEKVDLQGNNVLDIRYKDLLNDASRDGALFVQGNRNSKVDLGSTDWNSDTDRNLKDAGGGSWAKIGSATVDGISYDVYHHNYAGGSHNNDVYIQQGIMVI
ncbi:MAG: Ig-like domain-containing protein [Neisseria sp.]|nr:Ig-like domain-containing protein [Neisseria sp.]